MTTDKYKSRISPEDVIDMHVHHIGVLPERGHYLSKKLRRGIVYQFLTRTLGLHGEDEAQLEEAYLGKIRGWLDEDGAPDKAVMLGLDWVYDQYGKRDEAASHIVVGNDAVFEACDADERLLPAPSVNPQREDALDALDEVIDRGAVILKVLPNTQGFQPKDPKYKMFWRKMADRNLPLLCHTGFEHALPTIDEAYGDPLNLLPALEQGVTVVAAHCAAAGRFHRVEHFERFIGLIPRFENLYGDISGYASPIRRGYLAPLLASKKRSERILFGSDFPIPVSVAPYARKLGYRAYRQLAKDTNPLRRNRHLFEALGLDDKTMTRASRLLLQHSHVNIRG